VCSFTLADYAQDHAELGAALNGFSLNESGQLSTAIERTGQAVDATYMSTTRLVCPIEQQFCSELSFYAPVTRP
jgi:sorting nexin-41/42